MLLYSVCSWFRDYVTTFFRVDCGVWSGEWWIFGDKEITLRRRVAKWGGGAELTGEGLPQIILHVAEATVVAQWDIEKIEYSKSKFLLSETASKFQCFFETYCRHFEKRIRNWTYLSAIYIWNKKQISINFLTLIL